VTVAGVNNHRGVLINCHASRGYEMEEFHPAVVDGIDPPVFNYLHDQLRGVLMTPRDALDFLMLVGDIYSLVFQGLPRVGSAIRVCADNVPESVAEEEMADALARNIRRLTEFRRHVVDLLI
jgi:hypothetical protein